MKLTTECTKCLSELQQSTKRYPFYYETGKLSSIECDQGHKLNFAVINPLYDLLFNAGTNALLDDYIRESTANYIASLERFYEYYTSVLLLKQGKSMKQIELLWNEMKNSSERQFGAFQAIFFAQYDQTFFDYLSSLTGKSGKEYYTKYTNLRNKVIHQGIAYSKVKSIEYVNFVFTIIKGLIKKYDEKSSDPIRSFQFDSTVIDEYLQLKTNPDWELRSSLLSYLATNYNSFEEMISNIPKIRTIQAVR